MLLFGLYYYRKPLSLYLKKIAIAVVLIVTCMITYNQQITAFLLKADVNTWWRFVYWSHEMNILRETDFVGVGFGTPYVRTDEFSSIDDFSNDATQQRGGFEAAASINEISYVVAQHNSFVNMYYRMGFIGGSSFIYINYFILLYSARLIKSLRRMKKDMELRFFLWSEFSYFGSISIIAFNVGLETPRYFIPYLISVSIHLGLIRKYNYIYESSLRKFKNIPEITGSIISKEKPTILIPATR
jgi:O-antigen ligase